MSIHFLANVGRFPTFLSVSQLPIKYKKLCKKKRQMNLFAVSDCRQSGARTVVLAPFFSVCSNRSPKMIKKSILSSLSYRFFEASLLVFLDSCRQR